MPAGEQLKRIRTGQSLTAQAFADIIGVDVERYRKWELRNQNPKEADTRIILDFFGLNNLSELEEVQNLPIKKSAKDLQHLLLPHIKKPASKLVEGVSESMVNYEGKGTPVLDITFAMGLAGTSFLDSNETPIAYLNIPDAKGCDAFTTARGDSMVEYIYPGDWIGFKQILRFDEFVEFGEPYGIVTDEFELIKYLRKGSDKKHFLLASENEEFEDFEVPLKLIKGLFHIKKVLPFSPQRNMARRRRFSETA